MENQTNEDVKKIGPSDLMYTYSKKRNKLFFALSKAQGAVDTIYKNKQNGFYKSEFASLDIVLDAIRQPLSDNDLCLFQLPLRNALLVTELGHKSGQWMRCYKNIICKDLNSAHAEASGISYSRRYSILSIMLLAPKDDDGNEAENIKSTKPILKPKNFNIKDYPREKI